MKSRILIGFFVLSSLFNSCITEFKANLPNTDEIILIVEGSILENSSSVFYLSESFPLSVDNVQSEHYINNATLYIIGSNGFKSQPSINLGNGTYQLSVGKFDSDVEYGIEITYNGDIYQSASSKPLLTPEIDSINWIQPQSYGPVTFRVSTSDEKNGAKFFMWNFVEDWETTAHYYTTVFYNPNTNSFTEEDPAPYYYCWKKFFSKTFIIGSTESLRENKIINKPFYECTFFNDRFSELYCITVNQKAISKGAFEYYQNKILLNTQMGGLFTPQPSELAGNIICVSNPAKKAIGYIESLKNISQKRLFINGGEVTFEDIYKCNIIEHSEVIAYIREMHMSLAQYCLWNGVMPAGGKDAMAPPITPLNWAPERCTSCVRNGGTKNKPDFWPNNHK